MTEIRIPKLSHHKASGLAVVRLAGVDHYVGPWGSKVARGEYDRLVAEWLAGGRKPTGHRGSDLNIAEIMSKYLDFADQYYVGADGKPTTEPVAIASALKPLRRLYGHTDAIDFGPLSLKAVQQEMIRMGWCRKHINQKVNIIRRMFKWAVENELLPGSIHHALQTVSPLKMGRSAARESQPVKPVPEALIEPVLKHVSRQVAAIVRLQCLTGMRPGEAVIMRGFDIDTTGRLWLYRPPQHKTAHHGHDRVIFLGPHAKKIVAEFLKSDTASYLFSPAEADAERRLALYKARKTPPSCGNRAGTNTKNKPQKRPGARYKVMSYARAIRDACQAAFPLPAPLARYRVPRADLKNGKRWESIAEWRARLGEDRWAERRAWQREHHWHPHQLRHRAATELRKNFGLEAAQVILGHRTLSVTQIYAEKNVEAAMRIMAEVG